VTGTSLTSSAIVAWFLSFAFAAATHSCSASRRVKSCFMMLSLDSKSIQDLQLVQKYLEGRSRRLTCLSKVDYAQVS